MRMWTKSACVVLAWSILIILVAVGMKESVRPVQANIRIASSTTEVILASTLGVAAARVTARPAARYVVQPGNTLSGIAARFAVRGGWPALYAANRPLIGPNPNIIHPGTVLVLPGQAVGLLIGAALLAEPVLIIRRWRGQAAAPAVTPTALPVTAVNGSGSGTSVNSSGRGPSPGRAAAAKARIVMADYDRLVVTRSTRDGAVYVLRPPGEDPKAILRAARLVLPEDPYEELAEQLGVPADLR